jgi:hypothetical protein
MKVTFLEAHRALSKELGVIDEDTGKVIDKQYPNAKKFKTHTKDVANIAEYHTALSDAAHNFYGLLKGEANRENTDWDDRKNITSREAKTRLMILDIDGLDMEYALPSKVTAKDVENAAEWFISMLPPEYRNTSYVAAASSNFARKSGLRMHLHFILDNDISPEVMRGIITSMNLEIGYIEKHLGLTGSGRQLKLIVDPCLADNSRVVFIAPPVFGTATDNPFKSNKDRIVLVEKSRDTLDLSEAVRDYNAVKVAQAKEKRLKAVMAAAGVEYVKPKMTTINIDGLPVRVISNPEGCKLEFAYTDRGFVYYNKDGGDSNAYWVRLDTPEIVHSFKDEPAFDFRRADPETYAWHCENFAKAIEKASAKENDEGVQVIPLVVMEREMNCIMTAEYDPYNDLVYRIAVNSKDLAINWLLSHGKLEPDIIPPYRVVFDPTSGIGHDPKRKMLNTYTQPTSTKNAPVWEGDPLAFGDAEGWMQDHTPISHAVISNMTGNDPLCYEQFINWFAWLVQKRTKPETAWVLHGVEGTGKGLFVKRIARPLLGERYVAEKKLSDIVDDKFNGYMAECLLLFVDEFNMNHGSSNARKTVNDLKLWVTQGRINIREMQRNPVERETYFGMIFASNDIDAFRASANDRRYNVCPRQEVPLKSVIQDLDSRRKHYDDMIASEIPKLASMLLAFDIEEHRVRTPLNNTAKAIAIDAGQTSDESFFNALRRGDLSFFEHLATSRVSVDTDMVKASYFKRIVESWFADCLAGTPSKVIKDDLHSLFMHMTGFRTVNGVQFGKKCHSYLPREVRFRFGSERQSGFPIAWKYDDMDYLREYLEQKVDSNVTKINRGK